MKHKAIFILFTAGFCNIFLGSIIYGVAQAGRRHAEIDYSYRDESRPNTAEALDNANIATLAAHILTIIGAFPLALASAIGAWTIEDKYVKLGMLIFCGLITTFLLAPSTFILAI